MTDVIVDSDDLALVLAGDVGPGDRQYERLRAALPDPNQHITDALDEALVACRFDERDSPSAAEQLTPVVLRLIDEATFNAGETAYDHGWNAALDAANKRLRIESYYTDNLRRDTGGPA